MPKLESPPLDTEQQSEPARARRLQISLAFLAPIAGRHLIDPSEVSLSVLQRNSSSGFSRLCECGVAAPYDDGRYLVATTSGGVDHWWLDLPTDVSRVQLRAHWRFVGAARWMMGRDVWVVIHDLRVNLSPQGLLALQGDTWNDLAGRRFYPYYAVAGHEDDCFRGRSIVKSDFTGSGGRIRGFHIVEDVDARAFEAR